MGKVLALAIALLGAVSAEVLAQEPADESRWRVGAAFGYGIRSNPLVQSDDIPIIVDLDIAWFGDHFFFDNGDVGLTFADNETLTASLVGRFNSDRVFFGRTETRFVNIDLAGAPLAEATLFEVPDRDYAIELGIELLADGAWGQLQMTVFHDVSNTHDGYELYADYGYGWRSQRWYFEPSIGASYKSASLNNYYWGVRDDEVNDVLPSYQADSGLNAHARLMLSYQLSRQWSFSLVIEYERLNDEAAASPLVEDQDVFGYFTGFGFRFR
ncbi:MAG: MipA/OmpV family protein [Gammaproteobacteria bacterium]|nr:MipA/OmpV family protein [Gammaproteobacteria bacterium]